ncbi:MAG: flagellar basal body L-ring protein FlgH [Candidatus Caldatribacterium sp.]|uniref:flagellar basal body L-ring protein FlgH n=1 Tax=Candidatus Caldatribacterium sp. TaxID=2282143 RepID=UPI002993456F|nr:flagellar basal body L-ring protein FlgH [Candidatus Caldatribacterium sp.]MCX7729675.1 flagellar basal body L-ring protein FlgH [Candidatus Caldatribacterium sp.]MDW8081945.1 flagellar basal body L-ring protein FlgH [Candidatus Calescibacterium sp.]
MMVLFAAALLVLGGTAFGTSLWKDDGWFAEPYVARKACGVGDMVIVILEESAQGAAQASSQGSNTTEVNLKAGQGIFDFIPPAGLSHGSSQSGQRSYSRGVDLSGTIACEVTEVLENGYLKIAGKKEIFLNKERETMSIEGIIDPRFLSPENTISSTRVMNAVIRFEGTLKPKRQSGLLGVLQGFFGSILDVLF